MRTIVVGIDLAKSVFAVHCVNKTGRPEQFEILTGVRPKEAFVDRSYRGGEVPEGCTIYVSGQKRGITAALKRRIKQRSAIEAHIGHMKSDGLLGPCHLKGAKGDAMNAVLCGAGHNPIPLS